MSRFHSTRRRSTATHANFMGGPSWNLDDPLLRLRVAASSCFFGEPQYYRKDAADLRPTRLGSHAPKSSDARRLRQLLGSFTPKEWSGVTPSERMELAIDAALDHDVEATLAEAVRLRNEAHMRTTPQVILVRAAHHAKARGTGLVRRYGRKIILRADEPSVGLAYQLWRFGKPIPNALKRAWRDALEGASAYGLAKYRMESRQVKSVDVINLVHAKGEHVDALAKGTLKIESGATWERIVSAKHGTRNAWANAFDVMGHMALLRNLRNLVEAGIPTQKLMARLLEGAKKGRQLPFRYYSAYRALQAVKVPGDLLDAVEKCLVLSLDNLPTFRGRVMSLCDNSGSARGTTTSSMGTMQISTIANLQAVLTGMQSEDGHVGVFGDRLTTFPVRRQGGLFSQLELAEERGKRVGSATENGVWLFWDEAIRSRKRWDHVFVYSDMQAGHGGLFGSDPKAYADYVWGSSRYIDVPKLVAEYRRTVNPKVHVHLVQVAGYQDTIIPEHYDRTTILGGWGDGLLRFAAEMAHLRDGDHAVALPKSQ